MKSQASGRKVLHFAVTGALLSGGAMMGCTKKDTHTHAPNVAPVEEPQPSTNPGPEEDLHANPGPSEPDAHTNTGPVENPDTPTHVNTAPVDPPPDAGSGDEPPRVIANPAPQPDPKPQPKGGI